MLAVGSSEFAIECLPHLNHPKYTTHYVLSSIYATSDGVSAMDIGQCEK